MKNLIEWTDDLSVNIQEIDEQHKILVDLVNKLYKSIITRTEQNTIYDILNELVQYTTIHFAVEESLMRIFDYPSYEEHKNHHEALKKQVVDLQEKVWEVKEDSISMELLRFLRGWLTKHIMQEDKRYVSFFLDKGLQSTWAKRSWIGKIWHFGK
jgi:hemerythrin